MLIFIWKVLLYMELWSYIPTNGCYQLLCTCGSISLNSLFIPCHVRYVQANMYDIALFIKIHSFFTVVENMYLPMSSTEYIT